MISESKFSEEKVLEVRWWTESLLSFTLTRPEGYQFVPGQYSRLGLMDEHGQVIWRAYSVVSAPSENLLEYYGVLVPGGAFTSRLRGLATGDGMLVENTVYGFMIADRFVDGDALWMMATGTGLGPYISILRDGSVWEKFSDIVLVHGARHAAELSYTDEMRGMQQKFGERLRLVQAVTREPEGAELPADLLRGRLTTLLEEGELERAAGLDLSVASSRVMLCGNPEMITEMRGLLHKRGMKPVRRVNPGQFLTENYW